MSKSSSGSVPTTMRHGLISLLTVVIVLSLATAAVLAVATARAMSSIADRQATMTAEGYAAEQSAQETLAEVDDILAGVRKAGRGGAEARTLVEDRIEEILANACAEGVSASSTFDYDVLTCTYETTNGRMLETQIVIGDDARYKVASWKLTAVPEEEEMGGNLWTGFADEW